MTAQDALTEALAAWYRCECSAVQKALGYECPHEVALVEACREGLPAMADLARLAAIGEAVERLEPGAYSIHRHGDGYTVEYDGWDVEGDSLPEAVANLMTALAEEERDAAALEQDDE